MKKILRFISTVFLGALLIVGLSLLVELVSKSEPAQEIIFVVAVLGVFIAASYVVGVTFLNRFPDFIRKLRKGNAK